MTGFDLRAMVGELRDLIGSHCKKAYVPHYEQIVLRINPRDRPQLDLVIVRGRRIYTSTRDRPMPPQPPPFAMVLRKHLLNARLVSVDQHGFDRILTLGFETKHGPRRLVVECFRDGNVILLDDEDVILQPLTHATFAGRTLKRGAPYRFPPEAVDPHHLDATTLMTELEASDRDLVRTLGGRLNLGGGYANALCDLTGIEGSRMATDVAADPSEVEALASELAKLLACIGPSRDRTSWLMLASEDGTPDDVLIAQAMAAPPGPDRDALHHQRAREALPIRLPAHEGHILIPFPDLNGAIDAWRGAHDAAAYQRRLVEQDAEEDRLGTPVERLERRRDQQRTALASFERKVSTLQSKGHAIQSAWDHVETLLTQTREAVGNHGWEEVRQRAKRIPWIEQVDPSEKRFSAILPDDDHEPKGPTVWLQLEATVHQNAQTYFEQARKHKDKLRGAELALERTEADLQKARKQEQDRIASGKVRSVRRSKRLWFERHRWTILDGGHLMIGGRDAKGNDAIVRKHLESHDRYLHADLHGAPSCALLLKRGFELDPVPPPGLPDDVPAIRLRDRPEVEGFDSHVMLQAATMALCWSRAWGAGSSKGTVYWVRPSQVSKTAETGEFVGKGAFIVRGQRTWVKDLELEVGLGLICINGVPMLLAGPVDAIRTRCQRHAVIVPGRERKELLAKRLATATGVAVDDIVPVLPGASELREDHGLLER